MKYFLEYKKSSNIFFSLKDEFNLYQQMDQERYEREKDIYPNFKYPSKTQEKFHNYSLITYEEIPDWLKQEVLFL